MRRLKPLLTFVLCLTLFATSVTQAIARGQMAGGQMVQLCADGKAVTMMMDAQGNPVEVDHTCPDCIAAACGLPPIAFAFGHQQHRTTRLLWPLSAIVDTQTLLCASARGPPVLI